MKNFIIINCLYNLKKFTFIMIENKGLYIMVDESLDKILKNQEDKPKRFKSFLKLDKMNTYSLIESSNPKEGYSIKVVFNEDALKDYLDSMPKYISFESFNSKKCLIFKTAKFWSKNTNLMFSSMAVLRAR